MLGGDGESALVVDTRTHPGPGARDPRRPARPRRAAGRDRRQHARPLRPRVRQPGVPAGRDLGPRALPDDDPSAPASASWPRSLAEVAATCADELAEVRLDPPDRMFAEQATLDLGGREVRLGLPRPRPHGQRHRGLDPRRGCPVRRRPARERRHALLRRRLPDGLARDGRGDAPAGRARDGGRAGPRGRRGAVVRDRVAGRLPVDRRAGAAGPRRRAATSTPRSPPSPYPPEPSREPLERALAQLRGALDAAPEPATASSAPRATRRRGPPSGRGPAHRRSRPARAPAMSRSTSVIPSSMPRGRRSVAIRCQSARRGSIGRFAESMPSSATPRRMNGKTVV